MLLRNRSLLAVAALGGALTAYGCLVDDGDEMPGQDGSVGEQDGDPAEEGLGQVSLGLTLPDDSEVTTVRYEITRNGQPVEEGDIPVQPDGSATRTITGLAIGDGYRVVLTANREHGGACRGEAEFAIMLDQTTQVSVVLSCDDLDEDTGNVAIDGSFNICPKVTSLSVAPTAAEIGATIGIDAHARDRDGDALSFAWSAADGSFAPTDGASTQYTCATVGTHTLTVTVTDGPARGCTKSAAIDVECLTPATRSSQTSYVVPVAEGVLTRPILTVGDSPNNKPDGTPYRMVGIPDGLGAFDNGDGTFTLLANHELGNTVGSARAHGGIGSFVSRWVVRKFDLGVLRGEDLMQSVQLWNGTGYAAGSNVALGRFCSADLPAVSAFYDAASGLGTTSRFFMNGEETGSEGRAFAHGLDGVSYELPRLGKFSFENSVASPVAGPRTVVVATDDSTPGQVYVYVGDKQSMGTPIERAGLTNGKLFGIAVPGYATEPADGIPASNFTLVDLGNVAGTTGAQLDTASTAGGVTRWNRPEDAAFDPAHPNDLYFVTTNAFSAPSRLWRVRFQNVQQPELGGTVEALLDGSEGQRMLDNLAIDGRGHILLQEDVGGQDRLGQIFRYDIATDTLTTIAQHDPNRFAPGAPNFLTRDEESSGAIDATDILGAGWWLIDVQAHYAIPGELVAGGQFIALYDPGSR